MYITPAGLLSRFDATEMAQVGTPKSYEPVTAELLALTVAAGDRSDYTADEIAAADATLARMQQAAQDASNDVDLYIGARYRLPLADVPPSLARIAADIARFRLYDDGATDEVERRYTDALSQLKQIAAGTVALPANSLPAVVGAPEYSEGGRTFDRDTLRNF